jgi:type I restriction enzyme, S subunit
LSDLDGPYLDNTPRKITEAGLQNCAAEVLPIGSVLFSSRAPIGHVAVNRIPVATNQGFKSFVPDVAKLDAKFLFYWLRKNRPYLESLGNGATFREVSKAIVSQVEIPLPPLTEQQRIAAILDQAEALRAKRRHALAKLDTLTQSLFLDLFGDLESNPKNFPVSDLGAAIQLRGGFAFKSSDYVPQGIPLVRIGEVNRGGVTLETANFLPSEYEVTYSRFIVRPGDMLMSLTGTTGKDDYGNVILLNAERDRYFLNQRVAWLEPNSGILAKHFAYTLSVIRKSKRG